MNDTIRKWLPLAALLAALMLGGCGSSGDSSSTAPARTDTVAKEETSRDPCEPRRAPGPVLDPPRRVAKGKPASIELAQRRATLTLTGISLPRAIPVRFDQRPPFEPKSGFLVAITYEIENSGPGVLKPSEDLNARLLLRASGEQYPYARELPCRIPISASWAVEQGGTNPARPVPAGRSVKSAIVFIAPKQEPGTKLSLVLPEQVGIPLGRTG
ncbi:MAG TPA: hypothetical protein VN756_03965 [Solirubrobacterales bacterium]|nr:hypothetical protein [Solirubrobacterales bacterium]